MKKIKSIISSAILLLLLNISSYTPLANAQEDLGLCPTNFTQGVVTTGYVDCNESGRSRSERSDAEEDRIEFEAICNATRRANVTSSVIKLNSSNRFYADVVCRVNRVVPNGTTLCPADSQEIQRAFDNVICKYYGSSSSTMAAGQTELSAQATQCVAAGGRILSSTLNMGTVLNNISYYSAESVCILDSATTNNIECPYGFDQTFQDDNKFECEFRDRNLQTLAEARAMTNTMISICRSTTAGLGRVTESLSGMTSLSTFFSSVICEVRIPRYSPFTDQNIVRACDATCTEDVRQSRTCLNGGQAGGPGCIGASTQIVVKRCTTGVDRNSLCPLAISTTTVVPLLLLDDD